MNRKSAARREWVSVIQAVMLGLVLTYYAGLAYVVSSRAYSVDFVKFFASARALETGESIYRPLRSADLCPAGAGCEISPDMLHPNLNPPLLSVLLAPLAGLGLRASFSVWATLSLLAGLAACALMWRELHQAGRGSSGLVWLWIAFLLYWPTYTAFRLGQVTLCLLLPLVGAWVAARRGHDRLAGVLLGCAIHLKVFIALLVLFFAVRRRWRIVAWMGGSAAAVVLLTLPFVGFGAYVEHVAMMRTVTWFSNTWNASYTSVMTRVLGGSENTPLLNMPLLARALVLLCSAMTLIWLAWLVWPKRTTGSSLEEYDLGYGLTIIVMLLVSPLGWMYYFPFLVLPGYAVWVVSRATGLRHLRWGLLLAWGLSTIPTSMARATEVNDPAKWLTTDSVYFYGLVLCAIVTGRALRCMQNRDLAA